MGSHLPISIVVQVDRAQPLALLPLGFVPPVSCFIEYSL